MLLLESALAAAAKPVSILLSASGVGLLAVGVVMTDLGEHLGLILLAIGALLALLSRIVWAWGTARMRFETAMTERVGKVEQSHATLAQSFADWVRERTRDRQEQKAFEQFMIDRIVHLTPDLGPPPVRRDSGERKRPVLVGIEEQER